MKRFYKWFAILGLMSGSFFSGYYLRQPEKEIVVETEIQEVEKIVTKRIVEKEITPEGAVRETTTEMITENKESESKGSSREKEITAYQPQWSVEAQFGLHNLEGSYLPSDVYVGRRVFGNVWGTAGYDLQRQAVSLGVRIEF